MKKIAKIAILVVADLATLYLSGIAARVLMTMMGVELPDDLAGNIIVILAKIAVFGGSLMYSTSIYRNLLWDAAGVVGANVVGAILSKIVVSGLAFGEHYQYFIVVFVIEALLCVVFRFLIRGIGASDEYYDEDEEEDGYGEYGYDTYSSRAPRVAQPRERDRLYREEDDEDNYTLPSPTAARSQLSSPAPRTSENPSIRAAQATRDSREDRYSDRMAEAEDTRRDVRQDRTDRADSRRDALSSRDVPNSRDASGPDRNADREARDRSPREADFSTGQQNARRRREAEPQKSQDSSDLFSLGQDPYDMIYGNQPEASPRRQPSRSSRNGQDDVPEAFSAYRDGYGDDYDTDYSDRKGKDYKDDEFDDYDEYESEYAQETAHGFDPRFDEPAPRSQADAQRGAQGSRDTQGARRDRQQDQEMSQTMPRQTVSREVLRQQTISREALENAFRGTTLSRQSREEDRSGQTDRTDRTGQDRAQSQSGRDSVSSRQPASPADPRGRDSESETVMKRGYGNEPFEGSGEDIYASHMKQIDSVERELQEQSTELAKEHSREEKLRSEIEDELRKAHALLGEKEEALRNLVDRESYENMQKSLRDEIDAVKREREESLGVLIQALEEKESRISLLEQQMNDEAHSVSTFIDEQRDLAQQQRSEERARFDQEMNEAQAQRVSDLARQKEEYEQELRRRPYYGEYDDEYSEGGYFDLGLGSDQNRPGEAYSDDSYRPFLNPHNLDLNPSIERQGDLGKILEDMRGINNQLNVRTKKLEELEDRLMNKMNTIDKAASGTEKKARTRRRTRTSESRVEISAQPVSDSLPALPSQIMSDVYAPSIIASAPLPSTASAPLSFLGDSFLAEPIPPASEDPILLAEEERLRELEKQNLELEERRRALEDHNRKQAQLRELEEQKKRIAYMKAQEARNKKLAELEEKKRQQQEQQILLQQQIAEAQNLAEQYARALSQPQQAPAAPVTYTQPVVTSPQQTAAAYYQSQQAAPPAYYTQPSPVPTPAYYQAPQPGTDRPEMRRAPAPAPSRPPQQPQSTRSYAVSSQAAPPATIPLPTISRVMGSIASSTPMQATGQLGSLPYQQAAAAQPAPQPGPPQTPAPRTYRPEQPNPLKAAPMTSAVSRTEFTPQRRPEPVTTYATQPQSQTRSNPASQPAPQTTHLSPQPNPAAQAPPAAPDLESLLRRQNPVTSQPQSAQPRPNPGVSAPITNTLRDRIRESEERPASPVRPPEQSSRPMTAPLPSAPGRTGEIARIAPDPMRVTPPRAPQNQAPPTRNSGKPRPVNFSELNTKNVPISVNELDSLSRLIDDV